ncbi:MAG: class I SAM-dependent methyltransferase [Anaerolineales bacterium]|nr:class I SAM-dependent methyltransferase [Anaerolineales bacterium]
MFDYLASLAPSNELVWDCGTGNGQAALALADRFQRVIATDASAAQIASAFPHEGIEYRVEPSEYTTIPSGTVDLVTVGTAVHWFDLDPFYAEVRRVGKANAILAVWTYHLPIIDPEIDRWLERFYRVTLAEYWPERIYYLDQRYQTLPFPFTEIQPLKFEMEADWNLKNLIGFLSSWSAVRKLVEVKGEKAFDRQIEELEHLWGKKSKRREIRWPLHFRIGKVS